MPAQFIFGFLGYGVVSHGVAGSASTKFVGNLNVIHRFEGMDKLEHTRWLTGTNIVDLIAALFGGAWLADSRHMSFGKIDNMNDRVLAATKRFECVIGSEL